MNKKLIVVFLFFFTSASVFSQRMTISGNVRDTVSNIQLPNAVAMAIRIKDSTLVAFTRTNQKGFFEFSDLTIDTLQIIVSHPKFGEQSFYVFGSETNSAFDFGKIILPSKSQQLKEVVIYAFKDPVYYKGDTLVYTADSFKVRPNATVEDLLKKLPGIKVDAQGKITSQGKAVDQVLVDGDEFFGADPTVATKNLAANAVESVQVYEKKNESTEEGAEETVNVMNLKLKEDAKKGYFGKVSGASDFQKFYEGEFLANKFNNKQKISVFALGSNTPRSSFGWGDMYKYGLDNESDWQYNEEDDMYFSYNNNENNGIPQTIKSGFYYNDKLSAKTKLNLNYTYNNNQLKAKTQTRSQYFLADTTYTTDNTSESSQVNESHAVNFGFVQSLDSLTELEITPKFKFNTAKIKRNEITDFITASDTLARRTDIENLNNAQGYDLNGKAKITRKFKNRDRLFVATYNYTMSNNTSKGTLKSFNSYFNTSSFLSDSINQQKNNESINQSHSANMTYTEPLTKKIKLEFVYDLNYSKGIQDKKAFNYSNGEYTLKDSTYSNNFENTRMSNRFGTKFIYEVKKQSLAIGAKVRQVTINNENLITHQNIKQTVNTILPNFSYKYKFSDNKQLRFKYTTNSNQPTINQLQPIQDNSNPNRIIIGNPDLLPTFVNSFNLSYNSYANISKKYIWASINFSTINNAFSNSITYDSIGRTISKPINVNGNYNGNAYFSLSLPFFSKDVTIGPNLSWSNNNYSSYINGEKNITNNTNAGVGLDFSVEIDTLDFKIGYNLDYNTPSSTVNSSSNKPYSQQTISASLNLKLPWKFSFATDAEYNINSQRSEGYNINYVLWNASLIKTFFKKENFIVSLEATDLLNQNISTDRNVQDNVISDTKTNIINRYILLKAIFKFNSNKTKEDENDF
ncbi:MAG: hypothetical protein A3F72_04815 [Bacteroidetes bacterium RIFCSPLOWO2_12_FULL_35_15]|nr:MAG: hypothetical protein A3F72_04815 [Bacteroidetes bacterium RIFCSPLOWO2_12_FULL_35_15]